MPDSAYGTKNELSAHQLVKHQKKYDNLLSLKTNSDIVENHLLPLFFDMHPTVTPSTYPALSEANSGF